MASRPACLIALLYAATTTHAQTTTAESIDRLAKPYVDQEVVVGMTVGVLKQGEATVVGYGRFGESDPRTPDGKTIYEIGSMSKVFTGLLLADAVVGGRVTLNTPVGEILPRGVTMNQRGDQPIALWHLATHTSGLPRLPGNLDLGNADNPYAGYDGKQLAAFLREYKPRKRPCERILYSNLGAGLLGAMLARERRTDYDSLLKVRIAEPLGMRDTRIALDDEQSKRLAPPHTEGGAPGHNWDFDKLAGAGAIRSTVDDLLKFSRAHLESTSIDRELAEAIGLAWCVHQQPIEASDFAMGLGWHVARDGSTRWHNGQTGGYHSMMLLSRKMSLAVVVLANTATGEVDTLAQDLIRSLAGEKVEPRQPGEQPGTVDVPREVVQRYVGKYQLAPGAEFTVTEKNGKLLVSLTGQPTFRVYPRSETEWFYTVVEATLTFDVNPKGEATAVTLFQNGIRQRAKRIE